MASSATARNASDGGRIGDDDAPFGAKYAVERVLGQGGMGTVFEARHIRLDQRVAIKVLGSRLRDQPDLVRRFELEARACGSLSSAHAVRVFDIDAMADGTPFIVMELLTGRDLAQVIATDGPQSVSRSVRWLVEACDAISEAHGLGIIHRDLKPSNLFLAAVEGKSLVKVVDFGIAKRLTSLDAALTQALWPLGTPAYMSPEQVRCAKGLDVRTDIWSLGVTLYELVTGATPFDDASASACIAAIAADPVPDPRAIRPDLGEAFVEVLMRALAKNATDRYQSVDELVEALAPFASADDDDERVSAVRLVITSRPALTPAAGGASYSVRTFEPRPVSELGPAVVHAAPPSSASVSIAKLLRGRRPLRATIALAAATAVALATVAVSAQLGGPARGAVHSVALGGPARGTVHSVALVTAVGPPAPLAAIALAPPLQIAEEEDSPPVAGRVAVASRPRPPRPRPTAEEPRDAAASRSVHGGLSNPGF